MLVGQMGGERIRVAAEECWALFGDHALHAIGVNRLEVGQMADDLAGRPFAGDWSGVELLFAHSLYRALKQVGASQIMINQLLVMHGSFSGCVRYLFSPPDLSFVQKSSTRPFSAAAMIFSSAALCSGVDA